MDNPAEVMKVAIANGIPARKAFAMLLTADILKSAAAAGGGISLDTPADLDNRFAALNQLIFDATLPIA